MSLLSLILLSCMVVPIRDIGNITFSTSATAISNSNMNLLASVAMNIDDFNIGSIDNYENVRECTISPNKTTSRMVSVSLSKSLEEYAIRVE